LYPPRPVRATLLLMRTSLLLLAPIAATLAAGCTPAEIRLVDGGIAIAGKICDGVVVAEGDPGALPLCATVEEIAQAIADLAEQAKQAEPRAKMVAALAPTSNKALYKQILANRAKKASPR